MRSFALVLLVTSCAPACEPKASPPSAETGGMSTDSRVAAASPARPARSTLHRPCSSHAACSEGELCFTDTTCNAGSCQKAAAGCAEKSCACIAPSLCRTACVDHGACVACSLPPPPP